MEGELSFPMNELALSFYIILLTDIHRSKSRALFLSFTVFEER